MGSKVTLEKMTESEFKAHIDKTTIAFAKQLQKINQSSLEKNIIETKKKLDKSLPNGYLTEGAHFLNVKLKDKTIGIVRFNVSQNKEAFVYDFEIDSQYSGYGFYTIEPLKKYIKELGCRSIALHVFANNERALKLYQTLGFEIVSYNMNLNLG